MSVRRGILLAASAAGALALAGAAILLSPGPAAEPAAPTDIAKPQRIMSTNTCADLLLLMLVPRDRIASVSYLAHDAAEALMPGADEGVAINHGAAEEVVGQQPDLILASPWSTPVLRRFASAVGAPVVEIDSANSFEDIRRITRQVGAMVGEPARTEELIAQMDRKLDDLRQRRPESPVEVVAWSAGNSVPGKGTLTNAIIEAAGAVNLAASAPDDSHSSFGIEELLAAQPKAILRGMPDQQKPSLTDAAFEHPVIREAFRGRQITYPVFLHTCGLPQSADAAVQLHEALAKLPRGRAQ